jgi:hypothetical protein
VVDGEACPVALGDDFEEVDSVRREEDVDVDCPGTPVRDPDVAVVKRGGTLEDEGPGEAGIEAPPDVDPKGLLPFVTELAVGPGAELSAECTLIS